MIFLPKTNDKIFEKIISDLRTCFDSELISVVLYGSATGSGYVKGKSDINLLIILSSVAIDKIDCLHSYLCDWHRCRVATPLFMTEDDIRSSLDVYPVEFINIKKRYQILFGKDCISSLQFNSECVQMQMEREFKGKLLLLRKSFVESRGKRKALINIASISLTAIIANFCAFLSLKNEVVPLDDHAIIKKACDYLHFNINALTTIMEMKCGNVHPSAKELREIFKEYINTIDDLCRLIDEYKF